jgi:hypothetical protein
VPQALARGNRTVVVAGHVVNLKWCETCNIYRPPRCISHTLISIP